MPKNSILLFIFLAFLFNSCNKKDLLNEEEKEWLNQNKNLTAVVYGEFPPYQFVDSNGNTTGIFIDYLKLIEEKINYKFKIIKYDDWSEIIKDAKNNEVDLILEIQKTRERSTYLNFYATLFDSQFVVVTQKNNALGASFTNIRKKAIVVPENFSVAEMLKHDYPNINLFYEKDERACLLAVSNGKYDAYIGPDSNTSYNITANNITNLVITGQTPYRYKPTLAVNKKNIKLSHIIDRAVHNISIDERDIIFSNWVQKKYFPFYYKLNFWLFIITLVGTLLFASLLFIKLLKKKVKQKTKEIQLALNEAEKGNKVKTNFIQNISHEIRTPMNGILGYSELLKKEKITGPEQELYTNTIIENGKNLVHIVDNMLDISSLQNDNHIIENEWVNIPYFFEKIIGIYKPKANRKNIDLIIKQEGGSNNSIFIDKLRLVKILKNIIDNAVKFTNEGSVTLTYTIKQSLLEVHITDTGIGIKNVHKDLIFNYFLQLEKGGPSKQIGGIGLGLTVAKKNALILGGEVFFISNENIGSTFYVKIPLATPTIEKDKKSVNSCINSSSKKIYQILIAEDEKINFLLVNSILSKFETHNFLITRAKNGEEAVNIFKENKNIDLVLMDIRMPIMDGYEATSIIKKIRPNIPVIAHTAYSSDEDIRNAIKAGCNSVICKPVNLKEFKQTIVSFLN